MVNAYTWFVLLGFSVITLLNGCGAGISDKSLSYVSPSDAAIAWEEGNSSLLGPDLETVLIDPRPTWAYRKVHIPQSINIPYGQLKSQVWRLDDVGTIIVCGKTYNDSVAIAMSKTLLTMGFKDVRTIRGGLKAWEKSGQPVNALE